MNKKVISILTIAGLFACSLTVAQTQKTGFVNSSKIFQEIPEAKEAQKKLDGIMKPIQDELESREKSLQSKYEEYQKKEAVMTESAKKVAQQELMEIEQKYRAFRQEKSDDLAKQQERILAPIKDKILKAIETVAKAEKYTFVFDQTEAVQILLYGDPAHDITHKVIDKLKRGK